MTPFQPKGICETIVYVGPAERCEVDGEAHDRLQPFEVAEDRAMALIASGKYELFDEADYDPSDEEA